MADAHERPLSVAILAVGGQGGGVLTNWLVDTAEASGYLAHSTFVAGVAQRTGATVYCVEVFPHARAEALGRDPVFTPYPVPGDVDLVIVGEMAETGRALQKGFVTPNVTTLITSSHRIYTINEKSALGDGILPQSPVEEVARKASKHFVSFDMQAAADDTGSVISSVLLGAVAASGALPFGREAYESTIRESGRSVDANLDGFAAGFEGATRGAQTGSPGAVTPPARPAGPNGERLAARIDAQLPQAVRDIALHGALRTLDYQDPDYAWSYLNVLQEILDTDNDHGGAAREHALTREVARQLALQMCYEDTIRVADLKTRRGRFEGIREQVAAETDQPVRVIEYFSPRLEEFCDTLPAGLARMILGSRFMQRLLSPFFGKGRNVTTTSIGGFLLLHWVSKLRRFRRSSYRYHEQTKLVDGWLKRVRAAAAQDYDYALALARCIEIVKGYSDTYERGLTRYRAMIDAVGESSAAERAERLRRLHNAALADEEGAVFAQTIGDLETVH